LNTGWLISDDASVSPITLKALNKPQCSQPSMAKQDKVSNHFEVARKKPKLRPNIADN
jgi:hypothetical protein